MYIEHNVIGILSEMRMVSFWLRIINGSEHKLSFTIYKLLRVLRYKHGRPQKIFQGGEHFVRGRASGGGTPAKIFRSGGGGNKANFFSAFLV